MKWFVLVISTLTFAAVAAEKAKEIEPVLGTAIAHRLTSGLGGPLIGLQINIGPDSSNALFQLLAQVGKQVTPSGDASQVEGKQVVCFSTPFPGTFHKALQQHRKTVATCTFAVNRKGEVTQDMIVPLSVAKPGPVTGGLVVRDSTGEVDYFEDSKKTLGTVTISGNAAGSIADLLKEGGITAKSNNHVQKGKDIQCLIRRGGKIVGHKIVETAEHVCTLYFNRDGEAQGAIAAD